MTLSISVSISIASPTPARRRRSRQSPRRLRAAGGRRTPSPSIPRQLRADAGRPRHHRRRLHADSAIAESSHGRRNPLTPASRARTGRLPDALTIEAAPAPGGRRTPSPSPSPSRSSVPYRLIDLPPPARRHAPRTDEHLQESRSVSDS